ncbi:MAG: BlaI/MecI/CopY family transcriptional regulator [Planctomycetes bacterium]|nr:BlaI/MecI/CopY family transcriptional regulator [Planctomycetota bacterium]
MKKIPKISEAEWEVIKVVWAKGPCSARDVIATLTRADPTWHPKTIKTFLGRLVAKKALGFRKEGRAYLYRPLVKQAECVAEASETFLDRVFNGALRPMLAHFVESKNLSTAEIRELKRLLEEKEEQ